LAFKQIYVKSIFLLTRLHKMLKTYSRKLTYKMMLFGHHSDVILSVLRDDKILLITNYKKH